MSLDNLTGAATRGQRAARASQGVPDGIVEAKIATSATDEGDDVYVTIGAATQRTGPCLWMPRGETFPTRGDPCYIQKAVGGRSIVVWWRPA